MIYNFVRRTFARQLTTTLRQSYGELIYTQNLNHQSEFGKVPTYRVIDLEGQLIDKKFTYDAQLLAKILKNMIFVDEMDSILLKVKSQGKLRSTQEKYHFT